MKKSLKRSLGISLILAIGFFSLVPSSLFAQSTSKVLTDAGDGAGLKRVDTNCVRTRDGVIVGHANDCASGNWYCTDTDC